MPVPTLPAYSSEQPLTVTLTGVDDRSDPQRLAALSARFLPAGIRVEWGILYSPKRQGLPGRYPSLDTIRRLLDTLPAAVGIALHVCGNGVFDLLGGEAVATELVASVRDRAGRIQLNFNQAREPVRISLLDELIRSLAPMVVITQHNQANAVVTGRIAATNHAVLFDASGGRGRLPEKWPDPLENVGDLFDGTGGIPVFARGDFGYAGGLGPLNVAAQLPRIAAAARTDRFWIDMEGQLRTQDAAEHDWLNQQSCEAVLTAVAGVIARNQAAPS